MSGVNFSVRKKKLLGPFQHNTMFAISLKFDLLPIDALNVSCNESWCWYGGGG